MDHACWMCLRALRLVWYARREGGGGSCGWYIVLRARHSARLSICASGACTAVVPHAGFVSSDQVTRR